METPKLTKKNYELEEDYALSYECDNCGHYDEDLYEEPIECEKCGSDDIIPTTAHENTVCDKCSGHIDMWVDVYVANTRTPHQIICKDCYDELPSK